jgi:hypothetical protein
LECTQNNASPIFFARQDICQSQFTPLRYYYSSTQQRKQNFVFIIIVREINDEE